MLTAMQEIFPQKNVVRRNLDIEPPTAAETALRAMVDEYGEYIVTPPRRKRKIAGQDNFGIEYASQAELDAYAERIQQLRQKPADTTAIDVTAIYSTDQ